MDVGEHILKPRKDVNALLFARFDKREENAASLSAKIVTMEEPVFSSDYKRFDGALSTVVIYFKTTYKST